MSIDARARDAADLILGTDCTGDPRKSDAKEHERTMEALTNADAAYRTLVDAVKTLHGTAESISNEIVAVGSRELLVLEELVGIPPADPEDLE